MLYLYFQHSVLVIRLPDYRLIMQLDRPRTSGLCFSPKSSLLATWEPYFGKSAILPHIPTSPLRERLHIQILRSATFVSYNTAPQ